jgi:hypothetical protein
MGKVVFDVVQLALEALPRKGFGQQLEDTFTFSTHSQSLTYQFHCWKMGEEITDLSRKMRSIVLIDSDMINIVQLQARFTQAIRNGLGRKASPMLDPTKSLLFSRGDKYTITYQCS